MYTLSSVSIPYTSNYLHEYTLSAPYDISSATYFGVSSEDYNRGKDTDIEVAPDGFSYFVPYRDGCCAADFAIPAIPNAFTETAPNIGEVAGSMGFRLYDETFADPDGDGLLDVGSQITITGLPSGLTPTVKLYDTDGVTANTSGTSVYGVVELSGHATHHENSHDVSTLHIEFLDAAFTGDNAGAVASSNDPSVPVTIDFTNNNPPTNIALTNSNIADGTPSGSTVGTITFSDSDSGNTHSVTLASGAGDEDNGLFSINGSNQLVLDFMANHSSPSDSNGDNIYKVRVGVYDGITTSYQTFELPVVVVHGPAAVKANIAAWLRADNGTGVSTNSATVGSWTDKSGNNRDYTGSGTPSYQNAASDLANFNPIVRYSQVTDVSTNNSAANVGNSTMYVVGRPLAASDWRTLFRDEHSSLAPSNHPFLVPSGGATSGFYIDPGGYRPTNVSWDDNELALMRVKYPSGTGTINISKNGASGVDSVAGPVSGIFRHLGSNAVNPSQPFGDVAEIIIYSSNSQSITDERKIQSYLALKYGTGLSASVGQYVDTSGATVYDTSSYNSRVAGIAHDDQLDQRVSKSTSAGAMMTLASSGDFTSQNRGARPQLNEGQYFVVGDNNGSLAAQTSEMDATRYGSRVGRAWKVANTNGVTNTHLKFDGFDSTYALIVDNDGDFSSGASTLAMLNANGEVHNVTIPDGKFMTLAQPIRSLVELGVSTAASTDESVANNLPKLLIKGTVETNQTIELSRTGGTAGSGEYTFTSPTLITIPAGSYDGTNATAISLSGLTLTDDALDDGDTTIIFAISNPSSGLVVGDADLDSTAQSTYAYTITDDDTAGVTLSQAGSTIVEGGTATYNVRLSSQPTANVGISLSVDSSNATPHPTTLSFTALNWNIPQTVTVSAVNNTVIDSPSLTATITHAVTSTDSMYSALTVGTYAVSVQDDDTSLPLDDSDSDGVKDVVEDAGFNNGDGNGDGVADKTQLDVATSINPATGSSTTLVLDGACNNISESSFVSESMLAKPDAIAEYPVGLVDFRATCVGAGMSTTVTIFYSEKYNTTNWRYKKYDSVGKEYADISSRVIFGTAMVGGSSVTTVSFVATDGDPQTDEDKTADGTIVDPSGPAVSVTTTASLIENLAKTG